MQATYEADLTAKKPPKGVLNWVGQPAPGKEPPTFEARLYDVLFKSQNPASAVSVVMLLLLCTHPAWADHSVLLAGWLNHGSTIPGPAGLDLESVRLARLRQLRQLWWRA